ncbi:MAG: FHA domain-containing protein [Muribaculaceae bacterium]|nr:FHA domain-containing protein [Muribaculaceae bacterium]
MKEIECPSCGEMIPEDSKFCDQCGVELLECVNCGALGSDDFCSECGNPMVSRTKTAIKTDETVKPNKEEEDLINYGNNTVGGRMARKGLILKARKGDFILKPEDEAVIGRNNSPYEHLLSDCNLISRQHGKFLKQGRDWYIIDFGSTNGTLVNDVELKPNIPMKFQAGDVVDIGTYLFDVIER